MSTDALEAPSRNSVRPLTFSSIKPTTKQPIHKLPAYFWGEEFTRGDTVKFPVARGYKESRELIGDGSTKRLEELVQKALGYLKLTFEELDQPASNENSKRISELKLSDDLQQWRESQYRVGRILPKKGYGLARATKEVIELLGAENWEEPMLTSSAIYGSGWANLLIGAYDPEVLYSNYVVDLVFYYEHGYHEVFAEFEPVLKKSFEDPHALQTFAGRSRREYALAGQRYIKDKIELESQYKALLTNKTAKMNRMEAFILSISECSILGIGGEAIPRGFDKGGTMHDLAFSSPCTDVIDIGADINNSELLNSFLNTKDLSESGVVTENALRRVYDAYSHAGARMFTERWSEPTARMCAGLYIWHLTNDRHRFLRCALLGWPKARKVSFPVLQREGDWDEVFDEDFRTTGLSRPLKTACNAQDPCDQMKQRLVEWRKIHGDAEADVLWKLWWHLSISSLQYVEEQVVSDEREQEMIEQTRRTTAKAFSLGLIDEMAWVMSHANHHAWQISFLYEAAMFGSLLDDGGLKGKLDRKDVDN